MRKAGAIVQNMEFEGFSHDHINDVCRALFVEQSDEYMQKAWLVFAGSKQSISVNEFKQSLPLMGELS